MHDFTTKSIGTIITQAAKYKLFLTMAQQQIGQGMTAEMRSAVLNTSAQIAGRNSPSFYSSIASMLHVSPEEIEGLDRGEFMIHLSGVKPFKFRIHQHLLGWKHGMSDRDWEKVKADQLRRYCRPISEPAIPELQSIAPRAEGRDAEAVSRRPTAKPPRTQKPTAPKEAVPQDPFNVDRV